MRIPMLLSLALFLTPVGAYGFGSDKGDRHQKRAEMFQNLSEEERAALKQRHEKFKSMSKEERKAYRDETKSKWDALSEDEQAAFIDQNREKIDKILERQEKRAAIRLYGMSQLGE